MTPTARSTQQQAPAEDFLKMLRARTAPDHERLEAHPVSQSITAPDVSTAAYRRYLQLMQRVVAGFEDVLTPILRALLPDIDARGKQAWLVEDLAPEERTPNPYPPFQFAVAEGNACYALGAYYVLEGSTLGGRVILKSLPEALRAHTRYFEGYSTQTGPMWQSFMNHLSSVASTAAAQEAIINGATDAFAAIYQYFNTCLAHEDPGHC